MASCETLYHQASPNPWLLPRSTCKLRTQFTHLTGPIKAHCSFHQLRERLALPRHCKEDLANKLISECFVELSELMRKAALDKQEHTARRLLHELQLSSAKPLSRLW